MRSTLSLPEQPACSACPLRSSCKQLNKPGKGKATTADFTRFLYSWACQPPVQEKDENSLLTLLDCLPIFIKNINNYPVPLKRVQDGKEYKKFNKSRQYEKKRDDILLKDKGKKDSAENQELNGGENLVKIDEVGEIRSEEFQGGNEYDEEKDMEGKESNNSKHLEDTNDQKDFNRSSYKKTYDLNESKGSGDKRLSKDSNQLRDSKNLKNTRNSNDLNNYKENHKNRFPKESHDSNDNKISSRRKLSEDFNESIDSKGNKDFRSSSYPKETFDIKDKQNIRASRSPQNSFESKENSSFKDTKNQINSQDDESDGKFEPIHLVKASKTRTIKRKPPIIPDKLKWNPDIVDIAKQAKQERRQQRKSLESEVDLMVRRTTTKHRTRKSKHKRRRSLNKPKY